MPRPLSEFWHDPALPWIESRRACHSRACYRPHSHPTFSIGAVDAGFSHFSGAGADVERLAPGTLVMVPAQRLHACNPAPGHAWSYQMLHLDAAWLTELRLENGTRAGEPGAPARVTRDIDLYRQFCRLNATLFSQTSTSGKEAAVIEFIGDHDFSQHPPLPGAPAPQLSAPALDRLLEQIALVAEQELPLQHLAHQAGLGRYQLIRAFRAATGFTPHAYVLNIRINRARDLLRQGMALAEIACRLGFADQSHFQRVFKAHVGATPGHYRAAGAQ
ncbi:AraC family transcriptional regulator [Pseudomonas fulva]|nr:AraC family transcriptional regulator [Pseudomonas fulva]MBF8780407.1 helix-turn-helix transcriptional regulator [Pseudomonas fulva]